MNPTTNKTSDVVVTKDLWHVYKAGSQEIPALRGIDLCIPAGRFIALRGRSGSGKTTLLNCLAGLDRPTSGSIEILGRDMSRLTDNEMTRWRREQVGLVFQSFGLLPTLSAFENIELLLRIKKLPAKERNERTKACIDLVGLARWMHHRPYELSGGQQQRIAIPRALANSPKIILADEPTGELDSTTAHTILTLFKNIVREEQITLLMVSHDPLVDEYADEVLILKDGQIVQ